MLRNVECEVNVHHEADRTVVSFAPRSCRVREQGMTGLGTLDEPADLRSSLSLQSLQWL